MLGISSMWITRGVIYFEEKLLNLFQKKFYQQTYAILNFKSKNGSSLSCTATLPSDLMLHKSQVMMQDRCDSWRPLMFPTALNKAPLQKKTPLPPSLCCLLKWIRQNKIKMICGRIRSKAAPSFLIAPPGLLLG